jgi:glycosyltransferase involved in cell wall biosynthesis
MQNIAVQSKWVEAHVLSLNPTVNIFESKIKLRDEFLFEKKWNVEKFIPYRIFTSASTPFSYKGFHLLIKSFSIIAKKYPTSRLYIAARLSKKGFRQSGYEIFLSKLIEQNNLTNKIIWLGELDAKELVNQLLLANVYVMPSFIESYCLALDEAISIGTPTVSSFTGATPEIGIPNVTTLYYSPEDEIECAYKIEKMFDIVFAAKISENSYNYKLSEKNNISYSELQIDTYKKIISNN